MDNIVKILDLIKDYLHKNCNNLDYAIIKAVNNRKHGKYFSFDEHICGMFYALISGGAKWNVIIRNKKYIDETFFFFNKDKLLNQLETNRQYFFEHFFKNKCGIRFLERSLNYLYYNIKIFERIKKDYGDIENYVHNRTPYQILDDLSFGEYKLKGMRQALISEYLRNVGVDFSKPDTHILHILGKDCLSYLEDNNPINAIRLIEKFSHITKYSQTEIDFLLWHFCADKYGEICTKTNPKCNICPIRIYCKKQKNELLKPPKLPKIVKKLQKPKVSYYNATALKKNRNSAIENAYRMTISVLQKGQVYSRKQIETLVNFKYHNITSILPSDYCYNRVNKDIIDDFERRLHIFEYVGRNKYKYIGENFPYNGHIEYLDVCVGKWENGDILYLDKGMLKN